MIFGLIQHRKELDTFLNGLGDKYLPSEIRPRFSTTTHFMERLINDRCDNLNKLWVSKAFTILFRKRLCEFLYLYTITPHKGRINLHYDGKSIALVREDNCIRVITCFKGVALNPTVEYNVLSLGEENEE